MAMRAATTTAIPRHTTHHHLSCISQTAVFFTKNLRLRAGGQFRQQITVEWVNKKKRPQTDLYFNKI